MWLLSVSAGRRHRATEKKAWGLSAQGACISSQRRSGCPSASWGPLCHIMSRQWARRAMTVTEAEAGCTGSFLEATGSGKAGLASRKGHADTPMERQARGALGPRIRPPPLRNRSAAPDAPYVFTLACRLPSRLRPNTCSTRGHSPAVNAPRRAESGRAGVGGRDRSPESGSHQLAAGPAQDSEPLRISVSSQGR